ncbi:hypothetical protein IAG25_10855 [Caballeronia sp. EK]|uniref:hypothetical protein n=1 Tax=Caballeronia sp. EK TaxID=2767469 RepID=UPI00165620CA|nr:hypothetical protein [Caballeronia sp. EK]MBC8637311.1 hypothetical protein [Caballeronia sp. EK]
MKPATRVTAPVELLYLALLRKWVKTAPPDGKYGFRDGEKCCNSQTARLARVLNIIAAGNHDDFFNALARYTRKPRGDGSLVTRDKGALQDPYPLINGWYVEQCLNLPQKLAIVDYLTRLGLSSPFANAAREFVAAQPFDQFEPDERDAPTIWANVRACEEREQAEPFPPDIEREVQRMFRDLTLE